MPGKLPKDSIISGQGPWNDFICLGVPASNAVLREAQNIKG